MRERDSISHFAAVAVVRTEQIFQVLSLSINIKQFFFSSSNKTFGESQLFVRIYRSHRDL